MKIWTTIAKVTVLFDCLISLMMLILWWQHEKAPQLSWLTIMYFNSLRITYWGTQAGWWTLGVKP